MNVETYAKLEKYAEQLLAELNAAEEERGFDDSRSNTRYWEAKYSDFWAACIRLSREIGDGHRMEVLPDIACLYDILAGFVFGNASAYFSNEDGDCESWEEATELVISCEGVNATHYNAGTWETAGSDLAGLIASHANKSEYSSEGDDHQAQNDWYHLYK